MGLVTPSSLAVSALPALTLAIGVAAAGAANGQLSPNGMVTPALISAVAGPLLALVALAVTAPGYDVTLVAIAVTLEAIGTTTLYAIALTAGENSAFFMNIVTRHGFFVAAGSMALVAGSLLSRAVDGIARYPFSLLAGSIGLTAATALFGQSVNGARLWLQAGPFSFQPSELARLLLVGFIAVYLFERRHLIMASWHVGPFDLPPAPYVAPLAGAVLAAAGVLAYQNDLGMAALILLGAYAMIATMIRSRPAVLLATLLAACGVTVAFWTVPRVGDRVSVWISPWSSPAGTGFQFVQADYQLAGGSLLGSGRGLLTRIPEVHTDFVLVGVGAEFGLVVAAAVLALVATLVCRCALIALRTHDGLGALLVVGLTTMFGIQILLIAGGALRVLPLTGLTLPWVSYGGTSTIASFFALGVIVGVGAKPKRGKMPRPWPARLPGG